jgi:hypothetical protein
LAGEVLLIKDQGHFAIDSGRLYVVTAAVGGDREGFEGEVFSVTLARESIRAAKFLIAGEPAEYRGSGRHRGIGTDGPQAPSWRRTLAKNAAFAPAAGDILKVRRFLWAEVAFFALIPACAAAMARGYGSFVH